jgi:hypothetical protein
MFSSGLGIGRRDEVSFLVRVFAAEKEQGHVVRWARILGHEIARYLEKENSPLKLVRVFEENGELKVGFAIEGVELDYASKKVGRFLRFFSCGEDDSQSPSSKVIVRINIGRVLQLLDGLGFPIILQEDFSQQEASIG